MKNASKKREIWKTFEFEEKLNNHVHKQAFHLDQKKEKIRGRQNFRESQRKKYM